MIYRSERHLLTQEEAERLVEHWQEQLGLNNWDIRVKIVRKSELKSDTQGSCTWERMNMSALIKLMDPVDWQNDYFSQDMEETLIHELLHILFAPFAANDETEADIAQEQTIETIARALVRITRQSQ